MHLIIADDNEYMRWLVRATLRSRFFDPIIEVSDGRELFRALVHASLIRDARDVLVITDIRMPGCSGLEIIGLYDELDYHPTTVVMTSYPDAEARAATRQAGGVLIAKPFAMSELRRIVEDAYPS